VGWHVRGAQRGSGVCAYGVSRSNQAALLCYKGVDYLPLGDILRMSNCKLQIGNFKMEEKAKSAFRVI